MAMLRTQHQILVSVASSLLRGMAHLFPSAYSPPRAQGAIMQAPGRSTALRYNPRMACYRGCLPSHPPSRPPASPALSVAWRNADGRIQQQPCLVGGSAKSWHAMPQARDEAFEVCNCCKPSTKPQKHCFTSLMNTMGGETELACAIAGAMARSSAFTSLPPLQCHFPSQVMTPHSPHATAVRDRRGRALVRDRQATTCASLARRANNAERYGQSGPPSGAGDGRRERGGEMRQTAALGDPLQDGSRIP